MTVRNTIFSILYSFFSNLFSPLTIHYSLMFICLWLFSIQNPFQVPITIGITRTDMVLDTIFSCFENHSNWHFCCWYNFPILCISLGSRYNFLMLRKSLELTNHSIIIFQVLNVTSSGFMESSGIKLYREVLCLS